MKTLLRVLAVSTVIVIGVLFLFKLNLSADALLAYILGTILLALVVFVLFVNEENRKQDNQNFIDAMRRDEAKYASRRRKV